jgi:hypothetical protein
MQRERERAEKRVRKQEKKDEKKAALEAGYVFDEETGEFVAPAGHQPESGEELALLPGRDQDDAGQG